MNEVIEHRSPLWTAPALVMNSIGGGIVATVILPVVVIGVLCLRRRFWSALFYAIATALSGALVQLLKFSFERPRPTDILVTADLGSFPSGHTANAATLAVILGIVLQRTWVWFAGVIYAVAMAVSRTYLGAHWLSDTIGGLVLGAAVVVIVWTPLATRMHAERDRGRARRLAARRDSVGA
ncbi:phosphatase PAP2 family protein [Galbitalea soli]|uniref:Phosphatase PAP2 family protein n=2 Tax=Galbitalea soli TaxID=1268042 RepID=A0A7C9PPE8_9MICO|nr:phosphatase PAP2 family protein [Galbitalea soli]